MKTMLEARMVEINTARLTSTGQGERRLGSSLAMTCSSQGALRIATIWSFNIDGVGHSVSQCRLLQEELTCLVAPG
jgi:hypothetical protein